MSITAELHYDHPRGGTAVAYLRDRATCERKLRSCYRRHIWADLIVVRNGERERLGGVEIDGDDRWVMWFDPDVFESEAQP